MTFAGTASKGSSKALCKRAIAILPLAFERAVEIQT